MKTTLLFLAFLTILALPLTSCSQLKQEACALEIDLAHVAAPLVSNALQCNAAAVESSFVNVASGTALCSQAASGLKAGAIDPAICSAVIDAFVSFAQPKGQALLPAAWQCQLTAASGALAGLLVTACSSL